jgi:metal-responsive CopG/Arc/MetJ family transcriptional regulator
MNVYFPPEMLRQIADLADRKKLSRSAIVEAAVASFLSRMAPTSARPRSPAVSIACRARSSAWSATSASRQRHWPFSSAFG